MDPSQVEAELIQRNREIAKVRDEVLKIEKRLSDAQIRNAELLEKNAELDGEATKLNLRNAELDARAQELSGLVEVKSVELQKLRTGHEQQLTQKDLELTQAGEARQTDFAEIERLKVLITQHEGTEAKLTFELEQAQKSQERAKSALQESERSSQETASRAVEQRRRIKELEDSVKMQDESQMSTHANELQRLEHERAATVAKSCDLQAQVRELEVQLRQVRDELESAQREGKGSATDHAADVETLQTALDEAVTGREQDRTKHEEILLGERKRNEDVLAKANQHSASIDGRLDSQRMLYQESQEALERCENEEQRQVAKLSEKMRELMGEHGTARSAHEELAEKIQRDARALEAERQADEVLSRQHVRAAHDAQERASLQMTSQKTALEAELAALRVSSEEASAEHKQSHESLSKRCSDLSRQVAEAQEQCTEARQEVERLSLELKTKGDAETQLRKDLSFAESRVKRLDSASREAQSAIGLSTAMLAEQQTAAVALQEQLTLARLATKAAEEAGKGAIIDQEIGSSHFRERTAMSFEELLTQKAAGALEVKRLRGALEESRRVARTSLSAPSPVATAAVARIATLEQQVSEERRKQLDQAVALQRAERRCKELEQGADQRSNLELRAQEAERRATSMEVDLRKASRILSTAEQRAHELRELAAMTNEEMGTIRVNGSYDIARLQGALNELRYMLKMQNSTS